MARTVQPNELMERLESITDTERDKHLGTQEKWRFLSSALAEVWDKVIESGGNEYVKTVTFNTVSGQETYSFASIAPDGDFYKLKALYVDEGNGQKRPIGRLNNSEIQSYRPPSATVPMIMKYVPCAPVWDGVGDVAFDGINGYEELVVVTAALYIKGKKDDSSNWLVNRKRELENRIQIQARRDDQEPSRVVRRRWAASQDRFSPWRNNVSKYNITATGLELYYKFGSVFY